MDVPFVSLGTQYQALKSRINQELDDLMSQSAFIGGESVSRFESAFAEYCCAQHCIGVGNCTDALFIAMKSMGVGIGDEVITSANSFIASSEAISLTGASVVFVDVNPETYTMDTGHLVRAITPKTKAIIPVHLYGCPADMVAIMKIAGEYDLRVIEDAAQAHGGEINGRRVGTIGDVGCFSFYPGKNLGAFGDAGCIVTNDDDLAQRMRMFANHGRTSKYDHEFEGTNSRLDAMQAVVLRIKLAHLDAWNEKRRENANLYTRLLAGTEIVLPIEPEGMRHVFHLFVVRIPDRERVQSSLKEKGIATGIHYPIALPFLKAYEHLGHRPQDFPVSYRHAQKVLSLPMFPDLSSEQITYVCDALLAETDNGGDL